jgi:sporulation-control protein spo0M
MRAVHFARPFEYRLDIAQDKISQGMPLSGSLTIVNRDAKPCTGVTVQLALGHATFRQVKDKGGAALTMLDRLTLAESLTLAPGQEHKAIWTLQIRTDCPTTTKESGPFLLYGTNLDDSAGRGMIDIPVTLAPALEALIATVENHFAFEARTRKNTDGFIEVQFKPPGTYPTLQEFSVAMQVSGPDLNLRFSCKLKGFQRGPKAGVVSRRTELERTLAGTEFMVSPTMPNRERYKQIVLEALQEMTPALITSA